MLQHAARAARAVPSYGYRTFSAESRVLPACWPHSDLSYLALLRNLRLLNGLRGGQKDFYALVVGTGASAVASHMKSIEPGLTCTSVEGDVDAAAGTALEPGFFHAVIVSQPYHSVASVASLSKLRTLIREGEKADGALGMLWTRALPDARLAQALRTAGTDAIAAAVNTQLPALRLKQSPLEWIESLDAAALALKPFKHRKFVETLHLSFPDAVRMLTLTGDARLSAQEVEAALLAAGVARDATVALPLDLHAFHATVLLK